MQTKSVQVPGKKDIQLQLAENEGVAGIVRGTVAWLSVGLKIEETQYVAGGKEQG